MTDTATRLAALAVVAEVQGRAQSLPALFNCRPDTVLLGRHEIAALAALCLVCERRAVSPVAEHFLGLRLVRVDADHWLEVASLRSVGPAA